MSIDFAKLLPWIGCIPCSPTASACWLQTGGGGTHLVGEFNDLNCEAIRAIILLRTACDVMMRRKWWASYDEDGWRLDELNDECIELSEWAAANPFPDPITAIVETDKWYRENIEE